MGTIVVIPGAAHLCDLRLPWISFKQPLGDIVKKILLAAVLCAVAVFPVHTLDLGDSAPEIAAESWVTGEPVDPTKPDGNTIYLVEVWSVTCPPCVRSIPIMNDIQKRYADKGLKIVSFTSDTLDEVKEFLSEHPMEYSSFIDKDGTSTINYMAADNRTTIPHAFLFDKEGALVWIGNPLDNLEKRIQQVISGELNRERAVALREANQTFQDAIRSDDVVNIIASLKKLQELEPENPQHYRIHYGILAEYGAGDEKDVQDVLIAWYKGSLNQPESLAVLSMIAMDQGAPGMRNPRLALAAARRAYGLDSDVKLQVGLILADMYKSIGRIDLAQDLLKELSGMTTDADEMEMIQSIQKFYTEVQDISKNPDAPFEP